jgi:hypothetical protein
MYAGAVKMQSAALWEGAAIAVKDKTVLKGLSLHSGISFTRFRGIFTLPLAQTANTLVPPSEVILRHLRLSALPEAADVADVSSNGDGGVDTRPLLGKVTSLIWFVDTVQAARHTNSNSIAIRVEDCEAIVECDEVRFLQHFAQRLQSGLHGQSKSHAVFQVSLPCMHNDFFCQGYSSSWL